MPAQLVGLRCLSPPTREECDAAFDALAVLKTSTKKVGLRRMASEESAEKDSKRRYSLTSIFLILPHDITARAKDRRNARARHCYRRGVGVYEREASAAADRRQRPGCH